jgi:hypothetical protein
MLLHLFARADQPTDRPTQRTTNFKINTRRVNTRAGVCGKTLAPRWNDVRFLSAPEKHPADFHIYARGHYSHTGAPLCSSAAEWALFVLVNYARGYLSFFLSLSLDDYANGRRPRSPHCVSPAQSAFL